MTNRVHTPAMAKTDIMIQVGGWLWSGVLLVVLGLVGWCGDWVLVYGGHSGCFGLGMELLGLMTLASQGIPLLVLGVCPVGS